jgi:putative transposase
MEERREMIEKQHPSLSIARQCELMEIHRSGLYYSPVPESEENLLLMLLIDKQYYSTPFYGIRKVTAWLQTLGYSVNRKRVKRLMGIVGWRTIFREMRTSIAAKGHKVYPYLLKGLPIVQANQVWAMDITYVPMKSGFMYLTAIIDLHSRYVVHWSISNTMTAEWCAQVLKDAIQMYGKPTIFNTDQGSQFTSDVFTGVLLGHEIQISMDGKGRALDNIFIERLWRSVKYEDIYMNCYEDGLALFKGMEAYFNFYNNVRLHQSLVYETPAMRYAPCQADQVWRHSLSTTIHIKSTKKKEAKKKEYINTIYNNNFFNKKISMQKYN